MGVWEQMKQECGHLLYWWIVFGSLASFLGMGLAFGNPDGEVWLLIVLASLGYLGVCGHMFLYAKNR